MAQVILDGSRIQTPSDFFDQFFDRAMDLLPDYGGRNLDALDEDLGELREPLRLVWTDSENSRTHLGDWFDRCLETLAGQGPVGATPLNTKGGGPRPPPFALLSDVATR